MAPRRKSITPKYFGQGGISDKVPRIAYTANTLRFQSEEDLEIYIENHFDELFPDLELLQRQFRLHTQRYDLLCRNKHNHQAVLLELKNEEDRGIVWQLVRYRHLILTRQPFAEQIDYSLPIELIAIAPSFHEDSLIDKEACKFEENIKLVNFRFRTETKVIQIGECNHLIPYSILGLSEAPVLQIAPKWFEISHEAPALAHLMVNQINQEYHNDFWSLRNKFLSQPKVKEIINSLGNRISYATSGREGSKKLAEINVSGRQISLFLYLPTYHADLAFVYGRFRNPIKISRFVVVSTECSNLFDLNSNVNYLVGYSSGGLSSKEKENIDKAFKENSLKFIRGGMPKWSLPTNYISLLSFTYKNPLVFQELYPEFVSENPKSWWEEFKTQETDKLGWFVDLAIRAWRYKI